MRPNRLRSPDYSSLRGFPKPSSIPIFELVLCRRMFTLLTVLLISTVFAACNGEGTGEGTRSAESSIFEQAHTPDAVSAQTTQFSSGEDLKTRKKKR